MELRLEGRMGVCLVDKGGGAPRPRAQLRQRDRKVESVEDDLRVQQNLRKWLEVNSGGGETSWESTAVIQTGGHRTETKQYLSAY